MMYYKKDKDKSAKIRKEVSAYVKDVNKRQKDARLDNKAIKKLL